MKRFHKSAASSGALRLLALMLAIGLVLGAGVAFAGGGQESATETHESEVEHDDDHDHEHESDDHDHDDDHDHEHADGIPHIEPIDLAAGEKLQIVATTSIVGDVVRAVAGDAIDLTVMIGLGQNPHSYQPTPSAIRAAEDAHIAFTNGLELEENLLDDLESVSTGYIVPVSAGIEPIAGGDDHDEDHDHEAEGEDHDDHVHAAGDPHVWTDPNNAIIWVENIVEALSEADPANADGYQSRGDAYISELEEIDIFIRQAIREVPRSRRKIVVDHQAFNYFAEEYGLEVVGAIIPSTTDTTDPSARDVANVVDVIRAEDVRVIFVGRTASRGLSQLAEAVAQEVGESVRIVPTLTGSLAPAGETGDTYLGFLRYNAEQIVAGLQD